MVFSPEPRDGQCAPEHVEQVQWERDSLSRADEVIFWVPRNLTTLPAFTTNVEFGALCDSGRIILGAPPEAPMTRYLLHYAKQHNVPVATTLPQTIAAALGRIGVGATRRGGERDVPLLLWRLGTFQQWRTAQRDAGNTLLGARMA